MLHHLIIPQSIHWTLQLRDESSLDQPWCLIDGQFFLSPTSLFPPERQVKWCVLVSQQSFISVYEVERVLGGQTIKDISMHVSATGTQCMHVGLF